MNQNPIVKALRAQLEKEKQHLARVHNSLTGTSKIDFKCGYSASTERLIPLLERAVEMAEFYSQEGCEVSVRMGDPPYDGWQLIGDGKKAREFLTNVSEFVSDATTLADASGEMNKDGK